MGISHDPCARCGRAPTDADDHLDWEAIVLGDGTIALVCPSCVTQAECREIEEDWIAAEEEVGRPEADSGWA